LTALANHSSIIMNVAGRHLVRTSMLLRADEVMD
jgi:hypothetical protein